MIQPDYLMLGHFTRDVLPDGNTTPGGTSLYAALTAHRLGREVAVVSAPAELPAGWPVAIQIAFHPSPSPPTFENRYTREGRKQTLHAASQPITPELIPEAWRTAPLIHLGPVLGETPEALVDAFPSALLGVTPQGWMREWSEPLPGPVLYRPWQPAPRVLERINALVLSIEDVRGDEALAASYARHCELVALTRGAQGSTLFVRGVPHHIPAFPAIERDPTGAGDVFAATLFTRLHDTGDPFEAARFASYVAALSVEGAGISRIPARDVLEHGLATAVGAKTAAIDNE
ncbi:MAG TPA: PfkB family carbohydrate kinase [Roseiflexaceae bacterium]|nr:PfkB family carbohydrate kinase [Roseiflexaceae bacterium]